jgi:tRNA threonylcarbamoyladenosine modification (KEOPS) complex  Pcc1 subunit
MSSKTRQSEFYALVKMRKKADIDYMKIIGSVKARLRSAPKVSEGSRTITIEIEAKDLSALRSAFNVLTRDMEVVKNTEEAIETHRHPECSAKNKYL